jgi:hypothetical protein
LDKAKPRAENRLVDDLIADLHAANSISVSGPHALADQITPALIVVMVPAAVRISVPDAIVATEADATSAEAAFVETSGSPMETPPP